MLFAIVKPRLCVYRIIKRLLDGDFKINKHDRYVEKLYSKIKDQYDTIERHVEISSKKSLVAEIDLIATKGDQIDVYEVKCSYRIVKARKQLNKIHKLYHYRSNFRKFFYCGGADTLVAIL